LRGKRPCRSGAAEKRHELAASHSIASSILADLPTALEHGQGNGVMGKIAWFCDPRSRISETGQALESALGRIRFTR
jgi:hypothetical protein